MNSSDFFKIEVNFEEFKLKNRVIETKFLENIQNHREYFNLKNECKL